MAQARQNEFDAIAPGWCPAWNTTWQRRYRLLQAGAALPTTAGVAVVQGEDLGRWVTAQQHGWDQLVAAQQWLLENTLALTPAEKEEARHATGRGSEMGHEPHMVYGFCHGPMVESGRQDGPEP